MRHADSLPFENLSRGALYSGVREENILAQHELLVKADISVLQYYWVKWEEHHFFLLWAQGKEFGFKIYCMIKL